MNNIDDDDLIIIGETLEELDEDNLPRKKPVTIENQYALDAQGRRRFHGAFTGGFSAGYFNTVDTRDGWRPHQFKSSRTKKAGSVNQRPEDFMDEEDTGEFGIASTGIRASNDFVNHDSRSNKRERAHIDNNGPIPGSPVLKDLLQTVTDTVGVKLLRKMGWKHGQGVGPRLTGAEKRKLRQKQTNKKIYGCSLPDNQINDTECDLKAAFEDPEIDGVLFAPEDLEPFRCKPKDNYFGIGYRGLTEMSLLCNKMKPGDGPIFRMQDKNKKLSIRGQAFGVGAFEADDDDIYETDDMSRYDFALQPQQKKNSRWSDYLHPEPQQCSCLQGFVTAERRFEKKKVFTPPFIPVSFKPIHVIRRSRFSLAVHETNVPGKIGRNGQYIFNKHSKRMLEDSTSKDEMNRLPTLEKPELLSKADANSIESSQNSTSAQISSVVEQQSLESTSSVTCPGSLLTPSWIDKLTTKSFVRGNTESTRRIPQSSSVSNKEAKSFELSNETFDSGASMDNNSNSLQGSVNFLAGNVVQLERFEKSNQTLKNEGQSLKEFKSTCREPSQGTIIDGSDPVTDPNKHTDMLQNSNRTQKMACGSTSSTTVSDDVAVDAAKMKMFGKMTRTIDVWRPVNAVCKGFNIAEPMAGCAQPETGKVKIHSLFEYVDFCNESTSTDRNTREGVGTIPTNSQSRICGTSDNSKILGIHNTTESCDTSQKISTNSVINSQLRLEYKPVCDRRIDDDSVNGANGVTSSGEVSRNDQNMIKDCADVGIKQKSPESWPLAAQSNANAKHDLFKEIFLSSSESSESDNESTDDINSETVQSLLIGKPANELNTQRNTSPARGIFAQLDVDQITGPANPKQLERQQSSYPQTSISDIKTESTIDVNTSGSTACNEVAMAEVYGPALPVKVNDINDQSNLDTSSSKKLGDENVVVPKYASSRMKSVWVEKSKLKKSKKAKKKQKRRSRSKDRKHKHKSSKKKSS